MRLLEKQRFNIVNNILLNNDLLPALTTTSGYDSRGTTHMSDKLMATVVAVVDSTTNAPPDDIRRMLDFYYLSKWLNVILVTIVVLFGIYGNYMAATIFLSKYYKKFALRQHLVLLSLADLLFLIIHYLDFTLRSLVNLYGIHVASFNFVDHNVIFCKLFSYLRDVLRTISAYTLLFMSFQRFIRLYFPLKCAKWCSASFNKKLLFTIVNISLIVNVSDLALVDIVPHELNEYTQCTVSQSLMHIHFYTDLAFACLTVFLPTILITVLSFILWKRITSNVPKYYFFFCTCKPNNSIEQENSSSGSNLNFNADYEHSTMAQQQHSINHVKNNRTRTTQNYSFVATNRSGSLKKIRDSLKSNRSEKQRENEAATALMPNDVAPIKAAAPAGACSNNGDEKGLDLPAPAARSQSTSLENNSKQGQKTPTRVLMNKLNLIDLIKKGGYSIRATYIIVLISKWFILLQVPYFICWAITHLNLYKTLQREKSESAQSYLNSYLENSMLGSNESVRESGPDHQIISLFYKKMFSLFANSSLSTMNSTAPQPSLTQYDFFNGTNSSSSNNSSHMSSLSYIMLWVRGMTNVFEVLYLSSYSINFYLYMLNGPQFRKFFYKILQRQLRPVSKCFKLK